MNFFYRKRKYKRFLSESPVIIYENDIANKKKYSYGYATVKNYSKSGVYLRSDFELNPFKKYTIKTAKPSEDVNLLGRINQSNACLVWAESVEVHNYSSEDYYYGYGLKFVK